ncbi:DMT family transporter [Rothia sp. ZJ932]|uniref:EamA family transporter n=1 Tax=Rothia sp. ZJ932 TaxID=2810516 RepID=UPI00196821F3|nr:EamA family transporter [Rothia sp. ZJ932]QRZ62001.1 EamA family transporter [Rothia sp. ZJ932]
MPKNPAELKASAPTIVERIPREHRGTAAFVLVLMGSLGIQVSTAVAAPLFDVFSPVTVAGFRALIAAVFLAVLVRPNVFALRRGDWPQVLIYALVTTLMAAFFYLAVARIPLGIAVTIEFMGAFVVSLLGVKRFRDSIFAVAALVGVAMIAGPTFTSTNWSGYLFAALGAICMGSYTLLSARMGSGSAATAGLKGVTISMCISALLLAPFSVPYVGQLDASGWARVAVAGIFGIALAFSADNLAGRLTSSAVIGVLFSLDPVVGAIVGILMMQQVLSLWAYAGIVLIAVSGALLVWKTNRSAISISTFPQSLPVVPSTTDNAAVSRGNSPTA